MKKVINIEQKPNNPHKKRILFIITQAELGGAQKFLYELATHLDKEKYEILVASGAGQNNSWELLNDLDKKGIKTFCLKYMRRQIKPFYDFLEVFEIMKLINSFQPNFLYLNSSKTGVVGSFSAQLIKILKPKKFGRLKVIYRIGGWSFNDPWPLWKKRIWILAEKITAKFKDTIIVNNKNDLLKAEKLKIKPKKEIKVIYNGINPLKIDFFEKQEARVRLFKKLSKDYGGIFEAKYLIGTVANFYPTKGLEYLIEAVRVFKTMGLSPDIKNSKFIIIGDGPEKEKIKSEIKNRNLQNDIILAGQIKDAYKYLKAFDVFVLPSVKEGFPWAVLEAMAAKIPVIATAVGVLPEIIENKKNGILIEPKNPQQIAKSIKDILEDDFLRQEMGIQAHQTVLFKFSMEKMIKENEELFS